MNILLTLLNVMCKRYTGENQHVDNNLLLLSNERMFVKRPWPRGTYAYKMGCHGNW